MGFPPALKLTIAPKKKKKEKSEKEREKEREKKDRERGERVKVNTYQIHKIIRIEAKKKITMYGTYL